MRVLNKNLPSPLRDMDLDMLLTPNYKGFANSAALLPLRMLGMARQIASTLRDASIIDVAHGPRRRASRTGLYTGAGIEDYVAEMLADPDRTDDFRMLERELYLTATELDTTERLVLGEGDWRDVPISTAVAASTALPLVYEPGRDQGPGADRRRHPLDDERRHRRREGRQVHRRRQPDRPLRQRLLQARPDHPRLRVRRVSDMGFVAIANQAMRMIAHDRLHRAVEEWEIRYPGVDILLIEPEFDDEVMFGTSIMDYSARLQIAKHGFESVTLRLARDYDRYRDDRRAPRHRDLGPPHQARARSGRARARGRAGLAPRLRADDERAAAPERRLLLGYRRRHRLIRASGSQALSAGRSRTSASPVASCSTPDRWRSRRPGTCRASP